MAEPGASQEPNTSPREPRAARPRRSKGGQWGTIATAVVVILVAAYLVYSVVGKKSASAQYTTSAVSRGTLTVAVAGNGNVVSQNQASVNPPISGTVKSLNVKVGDRVTKGEVLFTLDNSSLDANVTQSLASYQNAKASTLKARQAETQADVSLKTGVLQAKQALEQAEAAVAGAKSSLAKAKSASPYDANAVKQAEENLDSANLGKKIAVTNYQHACTIQRQGHAAAQESVDAAVTAQNASYMNYQQSITTAGERTVTSPINGYVTTLNVNNGDQLGNSSSGSSSRSSSGGSSSGGSASSSSSSNANSVPIVISDLSSLEAQVQIAETDRPKVKIGQKVELTFDAVPNLTLTGKVQTIDAVGTSSSGVVTYNVTITFDVQDKRLNPGMTASANIVTQVDPDVLLVPNAAVKSDTSGGSYVQVLDTPNGTPRNVTVTVGPAGDANTEIQSGLTEGQQVVIATVSNGSSTSSSRSGLSVLGGAGRGGGGGFRGP